VTTPPLAFYNGVANVTYDFVVNAGGFYPFRLVWYEQGGGAHVEWFSQDLDSGERILLNASGSPIKAWVELDAAAQFSPPSLSAGQITLSWSGGGNLQEAPSLAGPWTMATNQANPQTVTVGTEAQRFYRIHP